MRSKSRLVSAVSAAALVLGVGIYATPSQAAVQAAQQTHTFNIPAGSLESALVRVAQVSGVQLIYSAQITGGRRAPALSGQMDVPTALSRLLAGTGLTYRLDDANTVTISAPLVAAGGEAGDIELGTIRVEGALNSLSGATAVNGINGSTDVTATEGTGSYATNAITIGGRTPRSLQETPQSVSVLTSERLEDQNVMDLTDAMTVLPGIMVRTTGTDRTVFESRGFVIGRMSIDGGAPLSLNTNDNFRYGLNAQIDMAVYDHVELLRGADGVVNGYGDPGGVINLVRKRPLDAPRVGFELGGDTWGARRAVLDVTGPITSNGRLRARAVATRSDNEYFYDTVNQTRDLYYGIVEFEPISELVFSFGINRSDQGGVSWLSGLPRGFDGSDLNLPRETAFTFPWSTYSVSTEEVFGGLNYNLASGWTLNLKLARVNQDGERNSASVYGAVDPATGLGAGVFLDQSTDRSRQISSDLIVNGKFRLFGREHALTFGANYSKADSPGFASYYNTTSFPPLNAFSFNPDDFPAPDRIKYFELLANGYEQFGSFANVGLNPWDPLKINIGIRYTSFKFEAKDSNVCGAIFSIPELGIDCQSEDDTFSLVNGGSSQSKFSWPPSASAVYSLTERVALYGSYASVYQDQSLLKDTEGRALGPIDGYNIEAGVRWNGRDGKLNASASVYKIEQNNFPLIVSGPLIQLDGTSCCYSSADQTYLSQGIDLELNGELFEGLQIAASYTYNSNERKGADSGAGEGQPVSSRFPEHLAKLWASYRLSGQGWVNRLTIGGGIQAQSSGFYTGTACLTPLVELSPGYFACPSPQPYDFTQKGYAVVSAFASYQLNENLSIDLNLTNVFDETYYQTVGLAEQGNWYGEPRSASITLRGRW